MSVDRLIYMLRLILEEKNITLYRLEKESHISHATLSDLYNEKYNVCNSSADLIYKLSKVLNMSMNELYELLTYKRLKYISFNKDFDIFKSSMTQELKDLKDKRFLVKYLTNDTIERYYQSKEYLKAIYLVSLIDYLCKKNNLPLVNKFSEIRKYKIDKLYVSESLFLLLSLKKVNVSQIYKESNPIFLKHNIVEAEIENVY